MARPRVLVFGALTLALLLPTRGGHADGEGAASWPAEVMAEPLELARRVSSEGDAAVLSRLEVSNSIRVRMQAIAACRWMSEPELALMPLAELARGSDPDLAPAATLSAWRVASALDRASLDAREADVEAIAPARAALTALAEDETARADLRRLAAFSADALGAVGVP